LAYNLLYNFRGYLKAGVVNYPLDMLHKLICAEEAEFVVLGPAADSGENLVRICGGQHEDHMFWRLLQRL